MQQLQLPSRGEAAAGPGSGRCAGLWRLRARRAERAAAARLAGGGGAMAKLRFAMVCASNMNRSMEAHDTLQKHKLFVSGAWEGGLA